MFPASPDQAAPAHSKHGTSSAARHAFSSTARLQQHRRSGLCWHAGCCLQPGQAPRAMLAWQRSSTAACLHPHCTVCCAALHCVLCSTALCAVQHCTVCCAALHCVLCSTALCAVQQCTVCCARLAPIICQAQTFPHGSNFDSTLKCRRFT